MKNSIITLAVNKPYTDYQERLLKTINHFHPDNGIETISWTDEYPKGSRTHEQSQYGFKCHAFQHAFDNDHKNVLWLDSPCYLNQPINEVFEQIERDGHCLITGKIPLFKYVNQKMLDAFDITLEQVRERDYRLLSGSFIGLSSRSAILPMWQYAESKDLFTSNEEEANQVKFHDQYEGHRHDEAALSLIAYMHDYKVVDYLESHFQNPNAAVKAEKW